MGLDALLTEDLEESLVALGPGAVNCVAVIMRERWSLSPFQPPRAPGPAPDPESAEFPEHRQLIVREVLWWASHDFWRQFGYMPTWRDVVLSVADRLEVKYAKNEKSWVIEAAIARAALSKWDEMPEAAREEAIKAAGSASFGSISPAVGPVVAATLRGLATPQIGGPVAARIAPAVIAGPIGTAVVVVLASLWTAYDLGGAAYRVIVPIVLQIAVLRIEAMNRGLSDALGVP